MGDRRRGSVSLVRRSLAHVWGRALTVRLVNLGYGPKWLIDPDRLISFQEWSSADIRPSLTREPDLAGLISLLGCA